jgi:hypothetical protein
MHPVEDGKVEFIQNQEWWNKMAPWIGRGTKVLSAGLQLAFAGLPLTMGAKAFEAIKEDVDFMNELAEHISVNPSVPDVHEGGELTHKLQGYTAKTLLRDDPETILMRAALSRMLEAVAPVNFRARQWGSLTRIRMGDNSYRWMCRDCVGRPTF